MSKTPIAFKGDENLKTMLLEEIKKHRKADQIIQGTYGKEEDGKWRGCAVGCSIHSLNIRLDKNYKTQDHLVYEKELGISQSLAYLEDRIFEGLPKEKAVLWPERFIKAIKPGADLSLAIPKFMVWLMDDLHQYYKNYSDVSKALTTVRDLYQRIIEGKEVTDKEWNDAARAAAEAAYEKMADKLIEILEECN